MSVAAQRSARPATGVTARTVGLLLALLMVLFGGGVFKAGAAKADAPEVNGCGAASGISKYIVPNAPLGFDFTNACNGHDYCYGAGLDKGYCDQQFLEAMDSVCDDNVICDALASLYHWAVTTFGQGAYDESTQARLDSLINDLQSCGGDAACEDQVSQQFDLDSLVYQLQACQGDPDCEQAVADQFTDDTLPPDPDPTATDPGDNDPGDPGSGDVGDGGDNGGDNGGGGDTGGGGDEGGGGGGGGGGGDDPFPIEME